MHSRFFGLRQYCSACHQWHFSPRNCALCISSERRKTISARSQKRMKRNRQKIPSPVFQGSWRLWKPSCVLFLNWFPFPWPPEGGQANSGQLPHSDRDTNPAPILSSTPTPVSVLPGTTETLRETRRHKDTENNKIIFFPPFASFSLFRLLLPLQSLQRSAVPQG